MDRVECFAAGLQQCKVNHLVHKLVMHNFRLEPWIWPQGQPSSHQHEQLSSNFAEVIANKRAVYYALFILTFCTGPYRRPRWGTMPYWVVNGGTAICTGIYEVIVCERVQTAVKYIVIYSKTNSTYVQCVSESIMRQQYKVAFKKLQ